MLATLIDNNATTTHAHEVDPPRFVLILTVTSKYKHDSTVNTQQIGATTLVNVVKMYSHTIENTNRCLHVCGKGMPTVSRLYLYFSIINPVYLPT
jgi:hypothetical protein